MGVQDEVPTLVETHTGLDHLDLSGRPRLAYRRRSGRQPALLFLPGYASDMDGAKATAVDALAARRGVAMLRFDYSGTGASAGRFDEGTLEIWLQEALAVLDQLSDGPVILVGSSMGGWLGLHVALRRSDRVAALVGIATAPDFTDWGFTLEQKRQLQASGRFERENPFGGQPQLTTRAFWESGERLKLLHEPVPVACPVRLVHGDADEDVPLAIALRLLGQLRSADVQLNIIKGGGHRLSEPHEIRAILRTVDDLLESLP